MQDTKIFIPTLKSPRLVLRALHASDHRHLIDMAHDAEVTRHLNEGPPPSDGDVWRRMAMALGHWALRGYGMFAIEDEAGFVGRLGIYHPFDEPDPQLSYILCRRGWGKGYATEGAAVIRDWMLATHRPVRLVSHIAAANTASVNVASKLGAIKEGTTLQSSTELDVWVYPVPHRILASHNVP